MRSTGSEPTTSTSAGTGQCGGKLAVQQYVFECVGNLLRGRIAFKPTAKLLRHHFVVKLDASISRLQLPWSSTIMITYTQAPAACVMCQ
jgi:hypothetical protein